MDYSIYRNIQIIRKTDKKRCWRYTASHRNYRGHFQDSQHLLWGGIQQSFEDAVYQQYKLHFDHADELFKTTIFQH